MRFFEILWMQTLTIQFFLFSLLFATNVFAQSSTITVLEITTEFNSQGHELYNTIRLQTEAHPQIALNDVPTQSLDSLLLAVGCTQLDAMCSETLSDILGSDMLIWGSLSAENGQNSVSLTMWDLIESRIVRERSHSFQNMETLLQNAPLIARSILYESAEQVSIVSSPQGATVLINGENVGNTPLLLPALPLGHYQIRLEKENHLTAEEMITIDIGEQEENFTLTPIITENNQNSLREESEQHNTRIIPLALMGVGLTVAAVGGYQGMQMRDTQSEFDDKTAIARQYIGTDIGEEARQRALELENTGEQQASTANLLYGIGGVTFAAGAILYFLTKKDSNANNTNARLHFFPTMTQQSAGFILSGRF